MPIWLIMSHWNHDDITNVDMSGQPVGEVANRTLSFIRNRKIKVLRAHLVPSVFSPSCTLGRHVMHELVD